MFSLKPSESRFALLDSAPADEDTMQGYKSPAIWNAVLSEIEWRVCTMLERAERWNSAVRDDASKRDVVHLHLLMVQVEGIRLADRNEELPRVLLHRMRLSVDRFFSKDVRTYRQRWETVQSLIEDDLFW